MKKLIFLLLMFNTIFPCFANKKSTKNIEEKVNILLEKMTLEEKIGQLNQPWCNSKNHKQILSDITKGKVGSILVTQTYFLSSSQINNIQKMAVKKSRLGIPLFFGYDVIHGFKTIFPSCLGLSSSWDNKLIEDCEHIAALEARAGGITMGFSPMVDITRDPRFGRVSESAGEDVLLNCKYGESVVKGFQRDGLASKTALAACVKHFVGDGACLGGRDKSFTEISKHSLFETYLPPFKACVDAGAKAIMVTFNDIAGIPMPINKFLMRDVVKNSWNYDGILLSDWDAIIELQNHGVAKNESDAASKAINAGLDIEMKSNCYSKTLEQSVRENRVSKKTINDAVRRVLRLKYELGLFSDPYVNEKRTKKTQLTNEAKFLARKAACESMILLKNNHNILPLKASKIPILVSGPFANEKNLMSDWTGAGDISNVVTIFDGIKANAPKGQEVTQSTNRAINKMTPIVCIGERGQEFGESHGKSNINIAKSQIELIKETKELYGKVIVVICSGRPLVLTSIIPYADAILQAWHPGTEAGNAVADIIFGKINPCGKTTISFPKASGQVPIFYSDRNSGRPRVNKYLDVDAKPLFPFGFGLSYTTFKYSNFNISKNSMSIKNDSILAQVTVTNTGNVDGKEIVELYMHDKYSSMTVPKKQLIDYKKVTIKSGKSKVITFVIHPLQLALWNIESKQIIEPGEFDLWVGPNSKDLMHTIFSVK